MKNIFCNKWQGYTTKLVCEMHKMGIKGISDTLKYINEQEEIIKRKLSSLKQTSVKVHIYNERSSSAQAETALCADEAYGMYVVNSIEELIDVFNNLLKEMAKRTINLIENDNQTFYGWFVFNSYQYKEGYKSGRIMTQLSIREPHPTMNARRCLKDYTIEIKFEEMHEIKFP